MSYAPVIEVENQEQDACEDEDGDVDMEEADDAAERDRFFEEMWSANWWWDVQVSPQMPSIISPSAKNLTLIFGYRRL